MKMLNTEMLEKLTKEKNMKDINVASILGMSPSSYSYCKAHKRSIKAKELRLLADLFGVTMDELYPRSPAMEA